ERPRCADPLSPTPSFKRSLLKQAIKGRARIRSRGLGCHRSELVRKEKVTEVCLFPIGYPLGLRLTTLVVSVRIVIRAVQTTVNVGSAMRALIGPRDVAFGLEFAVTLMADHNCSRLSDSV